jgi:hypothetical protein
VKTLLPPQPLNICIATELKKATLKKPILAKGPATLEKVSTLQHQASMLKTKELEEPSPAAPINNHDGHFDITSLQPLRSKAGVKKKWVELYCKGSREVLCCFRGHNDAAIALNLDRRTIRKMCEKQGGDFPIHASFSLMYASNKAQASAYHYGIHVEDLTFTKETYKDRLQRFKWTYEQDRNRTKKMQQVDPPPPTNEVPLASLQPIGYATQKHKVGIASNDEGKNGDILVTVIENESALLNQPNQGICIFCQDKKACIVFNPCRHSVLCEECFLEGKCRKFCPTCRITFSSTAKPEKIKLVRPRVFSAYALGDI